MNLDQEEGTRDQNHFFYIYIYISGKFDMLTLMKIIQHNNIKYALKDSSKSSILTKAGRSL